MGTRGIRTSGCSGGDGEPLKVTTWTEGGRAVADVAGSLDAYTAVRLTAALTSVQARAERPLLAVTVRGLTFCDSAGLGVMIGSVKRAKVRGGGVALVEVPDHLARILRVTCLGDLLPAFDTLELAWKQLDADAGGA